jgi:hypothetical protein
MIFPLMMAIELRDVEVPADKAAVVRGPVAR